MDYTHTICHFEIAAPDLEKAAAFYEAVFGWGFMREFPGPEYWFFKTGNDELIIGGAYDKNRQVAPKDCGNQFFIECDSIEETLAKIEAAGGSVTRGKEEISPEHGWDAYVVDPLGNHFGLHESPK